VRCLGRGGRSLLELYRNEISFVIMKDFILAVFSFVIMMHFQVLGAMEFGGRWAGINCTTVKCIL
jgi:hypothetical protein